MLRFIPTTNTAGPQLIAALWRLSRTEPGEQDTQGFGTLTTALDGSVWLAVDTTASVRVHATAELDGERHAFIWWMDIAGIARAFDQTTGFEIHADSIKNPARL